MGLPGYIDTAPRATWLGGIAALICGLAVGMARSAHTGPPHAALVLAAQVSDLPLSSVLGDRRAVFQVRNAGRRRLVISELDQSCGCGDRVRRTFLIPPGGAGEVDVVLDARLAGRPTESTAMFTTNDPTHPRFTLTVRALASETVGITSLPSPR